ncbi:hypothetical protein Y032_0172g343 [Ancylostoma ceylanicum]|uniref:Uncharacterized protein n=1 Tax=Ancylostoma ceylanicum TaxID=53326 RepID=A0A016SV03_9BILA|nr:hypothetical protein Y032_0172g343 [Ancylostoma ceylanicum]
MTNAHLRQKLVCLISEIQENVNERFVFFRAVCCCRRSPHTFRRCCPSTLQAPARDEDRAAERRRAGGGESAARSEVAAGEVLLQSIDTVFQTALIDCVSLSFDPELLRLHAA